MLSGLLAEEDELDRRVLWRIGSWGVGAVGAVIVAVMANQTSLGLKRDQMAAADLTRHAQKFQSVAKESQNEARRLASAVETLNGDRDRLYSRVTSLEQGLDSVTGAIARQGSQGSPRAAAGPAPEAPQTAPAVAPVIDPPHLGARLPADPTPPAARARLASRHAAAKDAAKTDARQSARSAKPEIARLKRQIRHCQVGRQG